MCFINFHQGPLCFWPLVVSFQAIDRRHHVPLHQCCIWGTRLRTTDLLTFAGLVATSFLLDFHVGGSINGGIPKLSIYRWIFHYKLSSYWGTPWLWTPHVFSPGLSLGSGVNLLPGYPRFQKVVASRDLVTDEGDQAGIHRILHKQSLVFFTGTTNFRKCKPFDKSHGFWGITWYYGIAKSDNPTSWHQRVHWSDVKMSMV